MASYLTAALLILASIAFVSGRPSIREELVTGTPFIIRSVQGGLLLKSLGGGQHCKGAGHVVTSNYVENAVSATWIYQSLGPWATFSTSGGDFYLNEFTFHPEGPFCYPGGRSVTLVWHEEGTVSFENHDGTCLNNNGNGERISWTSCDGYSPSQRWNLEKTLQ
ncbi:uncharacterized protein LOC110857780 [Folsomia candida]|uniref:uncharacterized protein LOC110857780 n=1 Tax=Folsomia candida TaxID=158441 RepID=UPI000B90A472|nr:uncharacterized protein LOC110857780 [Folsomia candida]